MMKKGVTIATDVFVLATVLLAGYAVVKTLPDLRRYIKISSM